MIDFFASITVAAIAVMTIVILISNYRQARILNQVKTVLDEWYQAHMRDRLEKHQQEITVEDPLQWFGRLAGVRLTELNRVLEEPAALEFLTNQGTRLVVSNLRPAVLRRKTRNFKLGRGKAARLVEPLLGRSMRKAIITHCSTEADGEWFHVEAKAALRTLDVSWEEGHDLWLYHIPAVNKEQAKFYKAEAGNPGVWLNSIKEGLQRWFKATFSKSSS